MAYIIKDTTALINTQLTDVGRRKISQGNFNVAYFQLGDSEVCYDCISGGNLTTLQVLVPEFNYQNNTGVPQSNKMGIKYPTYLSSSTGETNTFGIPFQDSQVVPIFNTAEPRGFFTGSTGVFSAFTSSALTVTANYKFNLSLDSFTASQNSFFNLLIDWVKTNDDLIMKSKNIIFFINLSLPH